MSPSRWAASPIGRLVVAAAIAGLAGGVTACDAGNNAPTLEFHPQSDGINAVLHGVEIENAFVLGAANGSLAPGQSAGVFLALYNNGSDPDQLAGVSAASIAKSAQIPANGVGLPVHQAVYLTGPAPKIVLTGLLHSLPAGGTVHVTFSFTKAGSITLDLPVLQRSDVYSTLSPAPAPSSASPTGTGTGTASPGATSSASASPSPGTSSPSPSTTP